MAISRDRTARKNLNVPHQINGMPDSDTTEGAMITIIRSMQSDPMPGKTGIVDHWQCSHLRWRRLQTPNSLSRPRKRPPMRS